MTPTGLGLHATKARWVDPTIRAGLDRPSAAWFLLDRAPRVSPRLTTFAAAVYLALAPSGRAVLAAAAGRSLVAVVRDAHRDEQTRSLVSALLAARPDLILVEMGLPFWRPPEGTSYLATYGASRASAHAAAELLGLAPA